MIHQRRFPTAIVRKEIASGRDESVNNKMFKSCIQCFAIVAPAVETRIAKCPRCGKRMRLQESKENNAKL